MSKPKSIALSSCDTKHIENRICAFVSRAVAEGKSWELSYHQTEEPKTGKKIHNVLLTVES